MNSANASIQTCPSRRRRSSRRRRLAVGNATTRRRSSRPRRRLSRWAGRRSSRRLRWHIRGRRRWRRWHWIQSRPLNYRRSSFVGKSVIDCDISTASNAFEQKVVRAISRCLIALPEQCSGTITLYLIGQQVTIALENRIVEETHNVPSGSAFPDQVSRAGGRSSADSKVTVDQLLQKVEKRMCPSKR